MYSITVYSSSLPSRKWIRRFRIKSCQHASQILAIDIPLIPVLVLDIIETWQFGSVTTDEQLEPPDSRKELEQENKIYSELS